MEKEGKTLQEHFAIIERLLWIGFSIMMLSMFFQNALWIGMLLFLGFGVMVVACVYHNKYLKCPHCGSRLNVRGVPNYCPDCGEKLV